jgi:hypothetical protein
MRPIPIERRSLPRSGRGRCDDEGRCFRRVSRVRREGARTSGKRGGDCGISRSVDRPQGRSILADARGRGGKSLYSGDAAGPWSNPGRRSSWCGARMPHFRRSTMVWIKSAGNIPMKNDPKAGAGALAEFFVAER